MKTIHDRMEVDLTLGGYSPATRRIYLLYGRQFDSNARLRRWVRTKSATTFCT